MLLPGVTTLVRVVQSAREAAQSGVHGAVATAASTADPQLQAAWMKMVRHVMANTEDVGAQFAEEARRIHYGETEERAIRGQTSAEEAMELLEEGIGVLPLALPEAAGGEGSGSLQ